MEEGKRVRCWWCSQFHCTNVSTRAPTLAAKPWHMVGFFCCVPCCKAYMISNGLRPFFLKRYLLCTYGIPLCTPLPTAPPWQILSEFTPDSNIHRGDYHNGAKQWDIPTQGLSRPHRYIKARKTKIHSPPDLGKKEQLWNQKTGFFQPLRRREKLPGKSIMDYMQQSNTLRKSPLIAPRRGEKEPTNISL